jgi:hypothetical protein
MATVLNPPERAAQTVILHHVSWSLYRHLPDLVIEIDITHPSLNKFPIFAGLGIPEAWRYHQRQLTIFKLAGGEYREQAESLALPGATSARLTQLIAEGQRAKRTEWLRSVREWARTLKAASP